MPQWISGELFTGSGKKYEDLKEKQVLVISETERKGYLLLCRMDRLRQNAFYAGTSKDYTVALSWLSHSLASQPTSARREGSGELSIQLLSRRNVISYAMFGLRLCDRGIISRCSAAPRQSGHANRETSTICSRLPGPSRSQREVTQLGQCRRVVV